MKPARILLLTVAILAGGLAAFLATRGTPPETVTVSSVEVQEEQRTKILVASQSIGVGERLSATVVDWQEWPAGAVRPEYVTIDTTPDAIDKLTDAIARFEIFIGEPIREAKLARADFGYLSAVIQPGMRGVSVDVTATSGAGGFIVPNDRVDVVLTHNTATGRQSETILQNVKILAIGPRLGELGKTGGAEEGDVDPKAQMFLSDTIATLELDPAQSEAIINAREIGKLSLVLRSVADFGANAEIIKSRGNAAISLIRFGKSSNVMTSNDNAASEPLAVTNASAPASANMQPSGNIPNSADSTGSGEGLPPASEPDLPPQQ